MRDNYNIEAKEIKNAAKQAKNTIKKDTKDYGYFSKVLKEPFDSIEELKQAEEAYFVKLKEKEEATAAKKAEAQKVEDAFVALNAARRAYKEELQEATLKYSEELINLKETYGKIREDIHKRLEDAECAYDVALKEFVEKHPEGYHLTLKDGDFETTISGSTSTKEPHNLFDLFNSMFGF